VSAGAPALTVVGCGPAWGNPGEPCSSYLVEAGGARILLDCGPGAFTTLLALDPRPLDAVVLSHLHFDHCADLVPFGYNRRYADLREWEAPRLLAPPGGLEHLASLCEAGGAARDHLRGPFALGEYRAGVESRVGDARLTFAPLRHPGVSHGIRIEAGGKAICFSGDTGLTPALAEHARGADVLLCEATLADDAESDGVHLSAVDAGAAAAEAGVGQLVLVHLDASKRARAVSAARTTFAGKLDAAVPGFRLDLSSSVTDG
jgi:ribonuclease BN (tRNA processing enzyme)